jgi:hypothetical protein
MRAYSWLRDLISSERGNVFVVAAAVMPLLLGSAAFAVDTIQLSVWKRQLQRAADSSAIAGAYAVSLGDDTHTAVHNDLDKNAFPLLTEEEDIDEGAWGDYSQTVKVKLTASRPLPFMSIFTNKRTTLIAEARAALVGTGKFCMVSLYDGPDAGIDVNGNATVSLGCGMKSNCTGDSCITAGGSSSIQAVPIASVGGIDGDSQNFVEPTTLQPRSAPERDPFAYLPNPTVPSNCSTAALTASNKPTTSGTYCYASASVGPSDVLNLPDNTTIIINNGDIDFKGDVNAKGVTWVMTGDNGKAGDLKINSQANLKMSSPDSGTYKGVLFYRDRRASNIEIKINGGADSHLTGALYFPSSDITYAGNSSMQVECLQMVGQKLKFRGGADITNECPTNGGAQAFSQTVVRLVV